MNFQAKFPASDTSQPTKSTCLNQNNGWNNNIWNVPTTYVSKVLATQVEFVAHGLPNFNGGCVEHYHYATDVITQNVRKMNTSQKCTFILMLGSQFNTVNPTLFYNRIVEIRQAIQAANQHQTCQYIFITQPFNRDSGKNWPMYGFSFYAFRQFKIVKQVLRDLDNVQIIDGLALTSPLVSLGHHKIQAMGKIPKLAENLLASAITYYQQE